MNSTHEPQTTTTTSGGLGFWKLLALVVVALIALAMIGPVLKALFWIGVTALAVYGGYMLWKTSTKNSSGSR
ncbi:MAG: hypothetical protein QM662_09830 [Gordonia sp. (in: high G+C Gram-positive bacteria)]